VEVKHISLLNEKMSLPSRSNKFFILSAALVQVKKTVFIAILLIDTSYSLYVDVGWIERTHALEEYMFINKTYNSFLSTILAKPAQVYCHC